MDDEEDDMPGVDPRGYSVDMEAGSPRILTQVSHLQTTPRRSSLRSQGPLDHALSGPVPRLASVVMPHDRRDQSTVAAFDGSRPVEPSAAVRDRITSTLGTLGNQVRSCAVTVLQHEMIGT